VKVWNNAFASSFVLKSEQTTTELYPLLQQAYGEDAMGCTQVFDWFRHFKEGRTSVESNPRSGQLSTSRNEEVVAKVRPVEYAPDGQTINKEFYL